MAGRRPSAVLVVTTLPDVGEQLARVLATPDIERGLETGVVVQSLTDLQLAVAAWWTQYWWTADSSRPD